MTNVISVLKRVGYLLAKKVIARLFLYETDSKMLQVMTTLKNEEMAMVVVVVMVGVIADGVFLVCGGVAIIMARVCVCGGGDGGM